MIYRIKSGDDIIFDPELLNTLPVAEARMSEKLNEAGALAFTLVKGHPLYDSLEPIGSYITVTEDGVIIFYGRVIECGTPSFSCQIPYQCEGALGFLNDSEVYVGKNPMSSTPEGFFRWCIEHHNEDINNDPRRIFTVGVVTIDEKAKSEKYSVTSFTQTKNVIQSNLLDVYGGYLRIRYENGIRYIDWVKNYSDTLNLQPIRIGVNIIERNFTKSSEDVFTYIRPVGANGITLSPNTIQVFPNELVNKYGKIVKTVNFSDASNKTVLLAKANEYIERLKKELVCTGDIELVEMSYLDGATPAVHIGSRFNNLEGLSGQEFTVTELERDLVAPYQATLSFGNDKTLNSSRERAISSSASRSRSASAQNFKHIIEVGDQVTINSETLNLHGEKLDEHYEMIQETAESYERVSAKVDSLDGAVQRIEGTGVIQNDELLSHFAGTMNIIRNPDGTVKGLQFVDGTMVCDTVDGHTVTVGSVIASNTANIGGLQVDVQTIEGSALWTERDNITGICGEYDLITDPTTGKKTLVIKSGGGLKIRRSNVEYGIYDEGNLTGGIVVNKLNDGTVTTSISGDIINLSTNNEYSQLVIDVNGLDSTVQDLDGNVSSLTNDVTGLYSSVSSVDGRVSTLTNTVNGLNSTVQDLDGNVSTLTNTVDGLNSTVTTIDGTVSTLTNTVDGLDSTVTTIDGNVSSLTNTVNGLNSTVQDLDGNVSTLSNTIDGMSSTVVGLQGDFSTLSNTVSGMESTVRDVEGNVSTLTNTVDGLNSTVTTIDGNMSTLSNTVNGLTNRVTDAEGNISTLSNTASGLTSRVNSAEGNISTLSNTVNGFRVSLSEVVDNNGNVTAASIATAINNQGQAGVHLSGSWVNIDGETTINDVLKIKDSKVTLTKPLVVSGGNVLCESLTLRYMTDEMTLTEADLGTMIKKAVVEDNTLYLYSMSGGDPLAFSKATALSGAWSGNTSEGKWTVTASPQGNTISIGFAGNPDVSLGMDTNGETPTLDPDHQYYLKVPIRIYESVGAGEPKTRYLVTKSYYAKDVWDDGFAAASGAVTTEWEQYNPQSGSNPYNKLSIKVDGIIKKTLEINVGSKDPDTTAALDYDTSSHKYTAKVYASNRDNPILTVLSNTTAYTDGVTDGKTQGSVTTVWEQYNPQSASNPYNKLNIKLEGTSKKTLEINVGAKNPDTTPSLDYDADTHKYTAKVYASDRDNPILTVLSNTTAYTDGVTAGKTQGSVTTSWEQYNPQSGSNPYNKLNIKLEGTSKKTLEINVGAKDPDTTPSLEYDADTHKYKAKVYASDRDNPILTVLSNTTAYTDGYEIGWVAAADTVILPGEGSSTSFSITVPTTKDSSSTTTYEISDSNKNKVQIKKDSTVIAAYSHGQYDAGWGAARSSVVGKNYTVNSKTYAYNPTSAPGNIIDQMRIAIPNSKVDNALTEQKYYVTSVKNTAYIRYNDATNGAIVAQVTHGQYNAGWKDASDTVALPSSGTSSSISITYPTATSNSSSSVTYTLSEAGMNIIQLKQGNTVVAQYAHNEWTNGYNRGWREASDTVELPTSGTSDSITITYPTYSSSTTGDASATYKLSGSDVNTIQLKNGDTVVAKITHGQYDAGWGAARSSVVSKNYTVNSKTYSYNPTSAPGTIIDQMRIAIPNSKVDNALTEQKYYITSAKNAAYIRYNATDGAIVAQVDHGQYNAGWGAARSSVVSKNYTVNSKTYAYNPTSAPGTIIDQMRIAIPNSKVDNALTEQKYYVTSAKNAAYIRYNATDGAIVAQVTHGQYNAGYSDADAASAVLGIQATSGSKWDITITRGNGTTKTLTVDLARVGSETAWIIDKGAGSDKRGSSHRGYIAPGHYVYPGAARTYRTEDTWFVLDAVVKEVNTYDKAVGYTNLTAGKYVQIWYYDYDGTTNRSRQNKYYKVPEASNPYSYKKILKCTSVQIDGGAYKYTFTYQSNRLGDFSSNTEYTFHHNANYT